MADEKSGVKLSISILCSDGRELIIEVSGESLAKAKARLDEILNDLGEHPVPDFGGGPGLRPKPAFGGGPG